MTIRKTVNLMMRSSDHNPYSGKLSKEDNKIAAIQLAELCLDFAEKGHSDEAMDLDANHWEQVITKLKQ
jgi:hypothetical protein